MSNRLFKKRVLLLVAACLLAGVASFSVTLIVKHEPAKAVSSVWAAEQLASQHLETTAQLRQAAEAVGLRPSKEIKGTSETFARRNEQEVVQSGYVLDPQGEETPMQLLVFVRGTLAAKIKTKGERPDLTQKYGLAFGAEKNTLFQVAFTCRSGDSPIAIAVAQRGYYFIVPFQGCP